MGKGEQKRLKAQKTTLVRDIGGIHPLFALEIIAKKDRGKRSDRLRMVCKGKRE